MSWERMTRVNRRTLLGAIGTAGVAGLAGCSGGNGTETTGGGGGTEGGSTTSGGDTEGGSDSGSGQMPDSMTNWAWNDPSLQPVREDQAAEFEEMTGTSINWQTFPFGDFTAKFTSALQGGNAPDTTALSVLWVPRYAAQNVILDLEQEGFSSDNYVGGAKRNAMTNGSLYSVPWYADCRALAINKTMFEAAGLEIPDPMTRPSWEEWKSWVDALAEEHGTGYGMPAGEGFDGFVLSNGGGYINDDASEAIINNDAALEAAEFLQPMVTDGKIETYTGGGATTAGAQFESKNIPMYYAGSWDYGRMEDAGLDWQYVPHPSGPQIDTSHTWSAGVYYSVPSRGGANQEAGLRFLEYISSVETQKKVVEAIGGFPGLKEAYETDYFNNYIEEHPKLKTIEQEMSNTIAFPDHPEVGTMWTAVHTQAEALWTGTEPKQALDKAAQEIESVL